MASKEASVVMAERQDDGSDTGFQSEEDARNRHSPVTGARVAELMEHSSSSVQTELDHAASWLRSLEGAARSVEWPVTAEAGAVGCLANVWGRLTLWSRANGTFDTVRTDLEAGMNCLVELRQRIVHGALQTDDLERLRDTMHRFQSVHRTVQQQAG